MDIEYQYNQLSFKLDSGSRRRLWLKLAKLIGNGVPIVEALQSIHDRRVMGGQGKHPTTVAVREWLGRLRNGSRFSDAIRGWVEGDEQMLLAAGEQAGTFESALEYAAEVIMAKKAIRGAVVGGLAYPIVLTSMAFLVLTFFSFKIIPEFSKIVPYEKWQGFAKFLVDLSNFTRAWMPLIIIMIFTAIAAFFISLPRWSNGLRIRLDRIPPYSVYRMLVGSTWMISFAALVNAGMRTESALQQLSERAAPWLRDRGMACLRGTRSGLNVGDALAKSGYGFPDPEIIDDLGVYARLSGFDQALALIGREWITESVDHIKDMMKVIFGISVLLIGGLVALMVSGLIGMEIQMSDIMRGLRP